MKNYFYIDKTTQQQKGPFTPEQLKALNIQPDTMVWSTGMDNWVEANTVEELKNLFTDNTASSGQPSLPPQLQHQPQPQNHWQEINNTDSEHGSKEHNLNELRPIPKNWLIESILATIFCCLPFGIVGIINATKVESYYHAGDYEAAEKASKDAKKWTLVSVIILPVLLIIYIIACTIFFIYIIYF